MNNTNEALPVQKHSLKTWPQYFAALDAGAKTFEIRKNDRDFRVGDTLALMEFDPQQQSYTGRVLYRTVSYLTDFAQQPGFVVLGLAAPSAAEAGKCWVCGCTTTRRDGECAQCESILDDQQ